MPPAQYSKTEPKTWSDGKTTHTTWEENEMFFLPPGSPIANELYQEAGVAPQF